ncbi:MAG: hypothetical protein LHV69_06915 [Elusimicrobia bacterium]|nr:hypothetical protein [Candidatus Obscuribacterium magneticum]
MTDANISDAPRALIWAALVCVISTASTSASSPSSPSKPKPGTIKILQRIAEVIRKN